MTGKGNLVRNYLYLLDRNPKEARALYADKLGIEPDSPAIAEEIEAYLRELGKNDAVETPLSVPARLLLAIAVRPRGKGKGKKRPPKPKWAKRQDGMLVRRASRFWRENIAKGMPSKRAKHVAATEALALTKPGGELEFAALDIATLKNRMRLRQK